ncbi:HEPN domain-containing protein [Candidatus Dependentiae bacterium]|nr:HEPN domain-containing protein [Candidatus Dependentiae bacterium]
MNYSELIKNNQIKKGRFTRKQVKDCLNIAIRDINTAKKVIKINNDWGYNIAYNAMLQAVRSLMFFKGYRAIGEGQHKTAIQFAQITLGEEFNSTLDFLDRMRRRRNKTIYDVAGLISKMEARESVKIAETFVKAISNILD